MHENRNENKKNLVLETDLSGTDGDVRKVRSGIQHCIRKVYETDRQTVAV